MPRVRFYFRYNLLSEFKGSKGLKVIGLEDFRIFRFFGQKHPDSSRISLLQCHVVTLLQYGIVNFNLDLSVAMETEYGQLPLVMTGRRATLCDPESWIISSQLPP